MEAVRLIEAIANIEQMERTDSGSLKVTAIARTPGVLTYFDSNGPRKELVTSDFLRSTDASGFPLAGQLGKLPVTLEHPPTLLRKDAGNISKYKVGETAPKVKVYSDGRIQVEMEVTDSAAADAVESGQKRGVSLGYLCNIDRQDGIYQGVHYDAKQCPPFTADHLAIVANPRAKNALIQSFERSDSNDTDFAIAQYEDFVPVQKADANVVNPTPDNAMGTETAATVAISDAIQVPEQYQIEINGSPHRVDAATYTAIQAERADMMDYKKDKKKGMEMPDEDDDDDNEYEDSLDEELRNDAAEQIVGLLKRCDVTNIPDAIHNLDVLLGRFDGVETVADVVDAVDRLQGQADALTHSDGEDARYDADDVAALLEKLDAESPAEALLALEGQEFVAANSHVLPAGFKFDGQTLDELRLIAIKHIQPGFELRNDSAEAIEGAFDALVARHSRVDSSKQLDDAFRSDAIHYSAGNGNRSTGTSMVKKPHESLFALSKNVRASGSK